MTNRAENARAAVRASTNHLAGVEWAGGSASAKVVDLSLTGARLATPAVIPVHTQIVVTTVRMGSRPARVIRRSGGEIGVKFVDEMAEQAAARSRANA